MKILAIEGSATVASVAILEDNTIIAEYSIDYKKTHSQTLMPMIDRVINVTDTKLDTIDAIAIAKGPGSFTGLRIAAATAKGLGMALEKPIIGVSTMEAMAAGAKLSEGIVCPIMDARRGNVYTGVFECDRCKLQRISDDELIPMEELINKLKNLGKPVTFTGDGVDVHREFIEREFTNAGVAYTLAPMCFNRQKASYVADVATKYYKEGNMVSAAQFLPEYLKETQAERELAAKQVK